MMFQLGDKIIHPGYGAGTVVEIKKLSCLGSDKLYYSIELLGESNTQVWMPIRDAEAKGIRHPIPRSQLDRIWRVLQSEPETLASDHNERYEFLQEKLCSGDILRIVEVVRDMFWKDNRARRLTIEGRRLYERGLLFLAGEVAAVQGCEFTAAKAMIAESLGASLTTWPAA